MSDVRLGVGCVLPRERDCDKTDKMVATSVEVGAEFSADYRVDYSMLCSGSAHGDGIRFSRCPREFLSAILVGGLASGWLNGHA